MVIFFIKPYKSDYLNKNLSNVLFNGYSYTQIIIAIQQLSCSFTNEEFGWTLHLNFVSLINQPSV